MPRSHQLRFRRDHRWTPDRLSAYLDNDLSPRARARVASHTDECPDCRGLLHSLRRLIDALGAPRPAEPVAERLVVGLRASLTRSDEQ